MTNAFTLAHEPINRNYISLLTYSLNYCSQFYLVERLNCELSWTAAETRLELAEFRIDESIQSEWPGTRLTEDFAKVYKYELNTKSLQLLCSKVNSLYSWLHPCQLEDLALINKNGDVFLGSIAHERDSFICLDPDQYRELLATGFSVELIPESN